MLRMKEHGCSPPALKTGHMLQAWDDHGPVDVEKASALMRMQRGAEIRMMDVLMVGTLLVSFGLVWLLEKWCQKQVDAQE